MKSKYQRGLLNNIQKNWLPEKSLREKTGAWKEASLDRLSWDKTWRLLTVAS